MVTLTSLRVHIKLKLKMLWHIIHDKQVIVITEHHGKLTYAWDTRSIEDTCKMSGRVYDVAYEQYLQKK